MFARLTVLISLCLPAVAAQVNFVNECPHEIWISIGTTTSQGSDDIGANGVTSRAHSKGWFRIGPYQSETLGYTNNYTWALIKTAGGNVISNPEAGKDNKTASFCTRREGFDWSVNTSRNTNSSDECRQKGGIMVTYQSMFNGQYQSYPRFTIFKGSCD